MASKKASVSDTTKFRIGMIGLFLSGCFLALGTKFLSSENLRVGEINFSGDEDVFGWVFIVISFTASSVALVLALTMNDD